MKRPVTSTVLFATALVLVVSMVLEAAWNAHSEIPPDRLWECLWKPYWRYRILGSLAAATFLLAFSVRVFASARRPDHPRRRLGFAGAAACAVLAIAGFALAGRLAGVFDAVGRIHENLAPNAYPGVIKVLDFRYSPSTFATDATWKAWIEFSAGSTQDFAGTLPPADMTTEAYAAARKSFPAFRPDTNGCVRCLRSENGFTGLLVPGESPVRCAIIAWSWRDDP